MNKEIFQIYNISDSQTQNFVILRRLALLSYWWNISLQKQNISILAFLMLDLQAFEWSSDLALLSQLCSETCTFRFE